MRGACRAAVTPHATVEVRDPGAAVDTAAEMTGRGAALAAAAITGIAAVVVSYGAAAATVVVSDGCASAAARRSYIDREHRDQDCCAN
jgi:hypothetical protein